MSKIPRKVIEDKSQLTWIAPLHLAEFLRPQVMQTGTCGTKRPHSDAIHAGGIKKSTKFHIHVSVAKNNLVVADFHQ